MIPLTLHNDTNICDREFLTLSKAYEMHDHSIDEVKKIYKIDEYTERKFNSLYSLYSLSTDRIIETLGAEGKSVKYIYSVFRNMGRFVPPSYIAIHQNYKIGSFNKEEDGSYYNESIYDEFLHDVHLGDKYRIKNPYYSSEDIVVEVVKEKYCGSVNKILDINVIVKGEYKFAKSDLIYPYDIYFFTIEKM